MSARFHPQKRIFVDSWSELLNLGSLTCFYNSLPALKTHFVASIGIESAYRESSLREKYLGDGAIASSEQSGRQIVQSCLAQNIKGSSAEGDLQQEVITRLKAKLANSPAEPERILAVTVIASSEGFGNLDFSQIAEETIKRYKGQTTYAEVFCIIPSIVANKPQVVVIPLKEFFPGGTRIFATIPSESFLGL